MTILRPKNKIFEYSQIMILLFQSKNGHCVDIDECLSDPYLCGRHGDCINYDGGFSCSCHHGFHLSNDVNSNVCIDIDECLDRPCNGGTCVNLQGSYECKCPNGFHIVEKGKKL